MNTSLQFNSYASAARAAVMMAALATTAAAQAGFTANISVVGGGSTSLSALIPSGGLLVIGPTNVTINSPGTGGSEFTLENFTASSNSSSATTSAVVMGSSLQMKNTSTSVKTLDVNLLDSGFTAPSGPNLAVSSFGTVQWSSGNGRNSQDLVHEISVLDGIGYASTIDALNLGGQLFADLPRTMTPLGTLVASPDYNFGNDLAVTLNPGDSVQVDWNSAVAPVPEPAAMLLMGAGSAGVLLLLRRRYVQSLAC